MWLLTAVIVTVVVLAGLVLTCELNEIDRD